MSTVTVIHCWSAPRSRSTALLYSFEARGKECVAIDEPLYRRWLIEKGESVSRPYTQEIIEGIPHSSVSPSDHYKWVREKASLKQRIDHALEKLEKDHVMHGGVIFIKHMAKHSFLFDLNKDCEVRGIDLDGDFDYDYKSKFTMVHRHLLLIRDPVAILSSWDAASEVHNTTSPDEVGIVPLLSIYSTLYGRQDYCCTNSHPVVIIDSDQLAADPAFTLWQACKELNIPYTESMLSWKSGPHDCDGCWAPWWYSDAHKSNGWFGHPNSNSSSSSSNDENQQLDINYPPTYVPTTRNYRTLNPNLMTALRLSIPAYTTLKALSPNHIQQKLTSEEIYEDARNQHVLVWVGAPGRGQILPRDLAYISPFDSAVQGGDAVWEGIRVYNGRLLSLDEHIHRLFKSAKALGFSNLHTKEEIVEAIFRTLAVNDMRDGVHIRLTLTRGEKCTSSMNPKFNVYGTTLIILPEWKPVEGKTTYDNTKGISLITSSVRRNSPSTIDSKVHHNNLINNILAKIQANVSGSADAIMLDLDGFVSETNATNLFMVEDGILYTPSADHCLPGITRETVLTLARELGILSVQRRISLAEFHTAEEVFTTGTMGGITPVTTIDGRTIGSGRRGSLTEKLQQAYSQLLSRSEFSTSIPHFCTSKTSA